MSWEDRPLPEDDAILAVGPDRTRRHDIYDEAMRLVGAKQTKGALVDLVNWLLVKREAAELERDDARDLVRSIPAKARELREAHEKLEAVEAVLRPLREDYKGMEYDAARVVVAFRRALDLEDVRDAIDDLEANGRDGWVGRAIVAGKEVDRG